MPAACQNSDEELSDYDPSDSPDGAVGVIECFRRRISRKPWSWAWTILLWLYSPVMCMALIERIPKRHWGMAGLATAVFLALMGIYTREWLKCGTHQFVRRKLSQEDVEQYVQRLRDATPAVYFHVECFHYEKKQGSDIRPDTIGWEKKVPEQQKVVSRAHKEQFHVTRSFDTTAPLTFLEHGTVTKVYLKKGFTFIDAAAEARFQYEYARFKEANKYDVHQTFSTSIDIPEFEKRMLCLGNGADPPWWLNSWAFAVFSLMTLSFPYRFLVDRNVGRTSLRITKAVG